MWCAVHPILLRSPAPPAKKCQLMPALQQHPPPARLVLRGGQRDDLAKCLLTVCLTAAPSPHSSTLAPHPVGTAQGGQYDDLAKYLLMVRKRVKDPAIDTELAYAFAHSRDLGPLEEFVGGTHLANLQSVGDRRARQQGCSRGVAG